MFLDSNYTFEAFFRIILIAIALVTLTIFFATPKPASKKPQDWNVSHLKGTISGVSSAKPRGIQKEIQETSSENIENEIYEMFPNIKKYSYKNEPKQIDPSGASTVSGSEWVFSSG